MRPKGGGLLTLDRLLASASSLMVRSRQCTMAGYVEALKLNRRYPEGTHAGPIGLKTHQRILRRSEEDGYAPARADINLDFPLRGTVACCEVCQTACRLLVLASLRSLVCL